MRIGFTWLDVKLAIRMLVKYPGLSLIGGLAIAFAITVGSVTFELLTQALHPTLPLPDGDRVVGVRNWDSARQRPELQSVHDFLDWRASLRSIESLGAFRSAERNLIAQGTAGDPVTLAEISASGFQAARVPPLLGRVLVTDDERPGATPVAVLGHELWQVRFGADPDVVGRSIRIGEDVHTVVGVMPEGFAFPFAHQMWTPLQLDPDAYARRSGPSIQVFGRLAPGASLAQAQAELAALGQRARADFPDTHEHLQPEVLPYAESVFPMRVGIAALAAVWSFNLILVLFLVLVFANVAMLVFARTATREGELVVRNALGASRRRIVMQLFAEALVLGTLAAGIGALAAHAGVGYAIGLFEAELGARLPFWMHAGLSPRTLLYAAALTLLGATIAGVLPALKVTGKHLQGRLQQRSAGAGGLRFGGVWTAVIVAQVAVTVAFPVSVYLAHRDAVQIESQEAGMASEQFLSVRLEMDRYTATGALADPARIRSARAQLERVLEAEPGVAGVTFATQLPRMYHPWRRIELDLDDTGPSPSGSGPGHRVSGTWIAPDFFDTLGAPVLAGRGFRPSDAESGDAVVIVNQRFVDTLLGGRNPIGRHLRYLATDEPWSQVRQQGGDDTWYRVIGVAPDLAMADGSEPDAGAGLYHPLMPLSSTLTDSAGAASVHMAVHVRGDPAAFAPRLHAIATAVDPDLRLYQLQPMDAIPQTAIQTMQFWFRLLLLVSAIALLLSLAGIYAVTSFAVVRRTREIGIRLALGAERWRVVTAVFARPLRQISLGLLLGALLGGLLLLTVEGGLRNASLTGVATFAGYGVLMLIVCLLACLVPTRRALDIEPTEALREDG